ncbi:SusD/RagB family nutrient-binding outer membrane lipoprotein [Pedobacter nutrimenti]|uniref:SusD/RagB family nutrient-binding outer membrane lipoprotein n=1 Tax=Pedobacter nutrimenti TaxID=1241337 RepID=UPI00292F5FB9|nr:SusD/RagB family nutrient-binding outer membrane lipoprotein [Pedobacter nutrimenti]
MRTKNIFNPKKLLLFVFVGAIGMTGCKKFLDINQNPNNPDSADPSLLLPTVQASAGQVVGNAFQVYGNMWAQYWTQHPSASQYRTIDQYKLTNTAFDRPWLTLYRNGLINAELIIKNPGSGLEYIKGIAYIMKAYTFQLTTDAFGDVPLTQALQGNGFGSPKYDTQELVYDSIFNFIDKGKALLAVNSIDPAGQDMIFGGRNGSVDVKTDKWTLFANTLKLRAYLRLAKINPAKAEAGVKALYASGALFLTTDAGIKYSTTGGNQNPFYNEMVALNTQNVVASSTAVNAFDRNNDPRVDRFYDAVKDQKARSIIQGSFSQPKVETVVAVPGALVGGNLSSGTSATAPVKLISAAESYFLQAEAAARGWATGDATALAKSGVEASFVATGLTVASADTYFAAAQDGSAAFSAAGSNVELKVKAVITQKYYAMCGFQGFEAWTDYRRTGYPNFLIKSLASSLGGNKLPMRLLYPNSEATSNLNFPGNQTLDTPVWWGKNTVVTPAP